MSDQQAELLPCPFCGARLEPGSRNTEFEDIVFHPGVVTDPARGGCVLSGKGFYQKELPAWNTRATPKSSEGELIDEAVAALQAMLDDWGGFRDVNGEEAASALAAKAILAKAGKAQS